MTIGTLVVTDAGIAAAVAAGDSGPKVAVKYFKIGSASAVQGDTALATDTDVVDWVYTGTPAELSYHRVNDDTVVYFVTLSESVGPFTVGNIGLYTEDDVLFARGVLTGQETKTPSSAGPAQIGDVRIYRCYVRLSNAANILDFTILNSTDAAIPVVPTELDLPSAGIAPFPVYLCENHTKMGHPTLAARYNSQWHYFVSRQNAKRSQTIISVQDPTGDFDGAATIGKIVYFDDVSNTFKKCDPSVNRPIGIRTSNWEITVLGVVEIASTTFTADMNYYAATGGSAGSYTTVDSGYPIGFSLSSTELWVDFGLVPDYRIAALATRVTALEANDSEQDVAITDLQNAQPPAYQFPNGQCRLVRNSATQLKLNPFNGNSLRINGVTFKVTGQLFGNTGVDIEGVNGNLGNNITYLVFAKDGGGGNIAVSYWRQSLYGHGPYLLGNANYGVEVLTQSGVPNANYTLIGMVRTDGSGQFSNAANVMSVRSWFNREGQDSVAAYVLGSTTSPSPTYVEIASTASYFLCWADDLVTGTAAGNFYGLSGSYPSCQLGMDGVYPGIGALQLVVNIASSGGDAQLCYSSTWTGHVAVEGYHRMCLMATMGGGGTGAYYINQTNVGVR